MEKFGNYYPGDVDPNDKYKLKRYNLGSLSDMPLQIEDNSKGVWVKWTDVEPLLKAYLSLINKRSAEKLCVTEITLLGE